MGLKYIFDNRFPRNLRIRYRGIFNNLFINNNINYLLRINKIDASKFGNKHLERVQKQAKYFG